MPRFNLLTTVHFLELINVRLAEFCLLKLVSKQPLTCASRVGKIVQLSFLSAQILGL